MSHTRREKVAILLRVVLLTSFILSMLAYIVLFIAPTAFQLQVVVAPQQKDDSKVSVYYLKHFSPKDAKVGDVLIYLDELGSTKSTTVTKPIDKNMISTKNGKIDYAQTVGIKQQEFKSLGSFYAYSLSASGRRFMLIYIVIVMLMNYLISYWLPHNKRIDDAKLQTMAQPVVPTSSEEVSTPSVAPVNTEVPIAPIAPVAPVKTEAPTVPVTPAKAKVSTAQETSVKTEVLTASSPNDDPKVLGFQSVKKQRFGFYKGRHEETSSRKNR